MANNNNILIVARRRLIFRLWSEITDDYLGPANRWPQIYRTLMWTQNLNHFQRFRLAVFIFINPCPVQSFLTWADTLNLLRDESARRHIRYLLLEAFPRQDYGNTAYAWSIVAGRYQYLNGTFK